MSRKLYILFASFLSFYASQLPLTHAQEVFTLNDWLLLYCDSANYSQAVNVLNQGANPNAASWDGASALMLASWRGNYKLVRELLVRGADINAKPLNGNSALHSAVAANHDSIAELLILNGAEINAANQSGVTPLHFACAYGYPFLTDLLIAYGAAIDSSDNMGNTPLSLSVYHGAYTVTQILLDEWADVDKPDNQGFTPAMIAAQFNDTLMLRMLSDYGARLDMRTPTGVTALAIALVNHAQEAADFLIAKGAAVEDLHPNTSYAQLAKENNLFSTYDKLVSMGIAPYKKPFIRSYAVHVGTTFNGNEFYMNTGIDAVANTFDISMGICYGIRPYYKAVLVESENISTQFYEIRQQLALTLEKSFLVTNKPTWKKRYFFIGINGLYSWGKYDYYQARTKPKTYLLLSPKLGFTMANSAFFFKLSVNLVKMDHLKELPVMVQFTTGFFINKAEPSIKRKIISNY